MDYDICCFVNINIQLIALREPREMGHEPVPELGVGRLLVAVGDEPLVHLAADVAGASPSPATSAPTGAGGRGGGVAQRGRALPDALLDATAGPTRRRLRSRRRNHPRSRRALQVTCPASPLLPPPKLRLV
uniref:Uncharacterized protein n=1 Tax=Arundo donax TaxID=35708 RepID=A0A0A9G4U5_ARUDO